MKKSIILLTLGAAAAAFLFSCNGPTGSGNKKVTIDTELDSVSYALGVDIATNVKKSGGENLRIDAMVKGIQDVYDEKDLLIDQMEGQMALRNYFEKARNRMFEKNLQMSEDFLEKNAGKKGIITTESGLQYEVLTQGSGRTPGLTDMVKVNYRGTLIDGREFDASNETPASFRVNGVIRGWTEALQLMPEGSKWKLYIHPDLAYGANPRPGGIIEPNHALIFEIELLEITEDPVTKK